MARKPDCRHGRSLKLSLPSQLADLLPPEAIIPQERLEDFAVDGVMPQAAVRPPTPSCVGEVMRWAGAGGISVFPRGGGTQLALGNVPQGVGVALDLSRQDRLLDYQPADMTATVQAGIPLNKLQRELASGGKFLPLEAPLPDRSTIGGVLAANTTGPLRFSYGQARDWLIGIGVVGADGVETKAGGKVVKNVTGYDLNKLYTGSLGTLGIIVEATFKLSPVPIRRAAVVASFSSLQKGIKAGGTLLGRVFAPNGFQVLDGQATHQLQFGLGNEMLSQVGAEGALAVAFLAGRPGAVDRRTDETARLLRESGATGVAIPQETGIRQLLERLTDLGWSRDTTPYLGIKITAPPSAVEAVAARCLQTISLGLPPGVVADPGYGLVRLYWWAGPVSHLIDESLALEALVRTREVAKEAGGSAVVEHCPFSLKRQIDVWGGHPRGIEIMRRIKQKFDPLGILNPGRFVGGI